MFLRQQGNSVFFPGLLKLWMCLTGSSPGTETYHLPGCGGTSTLPENRTRSALVPWETKPQAQSCKTWYGFEVTRPQVVFFLSKMFELHRPMAFECLSASYIRVSTYFVPFKRLKFNSRRGTTDEKRYALTNVRHDRRMTRSTIEVAHFRYFFSGWRGFSTKTRRKANLVSKKTWLYTWGMGVSIAMHFGFCWSQFSDEVWSSSSEEGALGHSEWTSIVERLESKTC